MVKGRLDLNVFGCGKDNKCEFQKFNNVLKCINCEIAMDIGPFNCVNSLTNPSQSVSLEISGMREEHKDEFITLESFFFQKKDKVSTIDDRIRHGENEGLPKNYYLSTLLNFEHAFNLIPLKGNETVLEIGAEHDFPFLKKFHSKGCSCYATNIFFAYDQNEPIAQVVLGDMNNLPFKAQIFDVILLSATSHHSPSLADLISELKRVLKIGGFLILINDPTKGFFKHSFNFLGNGTPCGGNRHSKINENEYSILEYRKNANQNGFRVINSFFSIYYDRKLSDGSTKGVRFGFIAKMMCFFWKLKAFRYLFSKYFLFVGQLFLGLELNMILRREK